MMNDVDIKVDDVDIKVDDTDAVVDNTNVKIITINTEIICPVKVETITTKKSTTPTLFNYFQKVEKKFID